jgi:hypothetical protein
VGDPNQRKPDRPKVLHVIQLCLIWADFILQATLVNDGKEGF